jgi:predicted CoA-binding protein
MSELETAVRAFLSSPRIAVAGVSRDRRQAANAIFRRLRDSGHQVFATNPRAESVEDGSCYPDLRSIPGGVDAVLIATPPEAALAIVRECIDLGIRRVWMHRSFGRGSVSEDAVALGRKNRITVIDGACPMMYCPPVDVAHRCLRTLLAWLGRLPDPGEAREGHSR